MTEDFDLDGPIAVDGYTFSRPVVSFSEDGTMTVLASVTHAFPHHGDPRTLSNCSVWVGGQLVVWGGHNIQVDYSDTHRLDFTLTVPRWEIVSPAGPVEVAVGFAAWVTPPGTVAFVRQQAVLPERRLLTLAPNTILRSLFQTSYQDMQTYMEDIRAAGFNALEIGCFKNPADGGSPDLTYEEWDAARFQFVQPIVNLAVVEGMYIVAIGDDFVATGQERTWFANAAIGAQVARRTAGMLRDSGKCVCVEMVDEATEKGDLHLHPATVLLVSTWRGTPGAPPIGWPSAYTLEPPQPTPMTQFEEAGLCDYVSRYHRPSEMGRANGNTLPGIAKAKRNSFRGIPPGLPLIGLVGAMGPHYWKRVAGGDFQEGDSVVNVGSRPMDIRAEVWLNLIYGCCGYRVYAFDRDGMVADRANALADGTALLQTGTKPGDERWAALAEVNAQVDQLTPHLLDVVRGVEHRGHLVIGRWPGLTVTVNTSESPVEGVEPGGVVVEEA